MLFNSLEFAIFLPIVFAVYWLLQKRLWLQNLFVVIASYVFYGWWDWRFLLLIAFTSLCSWLSGILIARNKTKINTVPAINIDKGLDINKNAESSDTCSIPNSIDHQSAREQAPGQPNAQSYSIDSVTQILSNDSFRKNVDFINLEKSEKLLCGVGAKFWLWLNIAINIGILAIFKYYDFFVSEFGAMFGINTSSLLLRVILPVGISFYTFQALSYSIDVYRGNIKPTKDIVAFFAFISFFPQLVAGPIERATNLLPQFLQKRTFSYDQGVDGVRQIIWGLFKKIVIADNCATYVDLVWSTYGTQSGSTLLLAAVLFTFQIYGDFSGYSDIAIGTAKLFGIRLMRNFNNPYFSRDIAEFWRRWHISLTSWFRDYVYIPLGGSRPDLRTKTQINTACAAINIDIDGNQKRGDSVCCEQHPSSISADSVVVCELPLQNHPLSSDSIPQGIESSPYENVDSINLEKSEKQVIVERKRKLITICNTFVVFMLCAIWHGANWTYMVWGLYHVVLFVPLIIMNRTHRYKSGEWRAESGESRVERREWRDVWRILLTFVLVTIGWIIFRAPTVADAWGYVSAMCTAGWGLPYIADYTLWVAIAMIGVMLVVESRVESGELRAESVERRVGNGKWRVLWDYMLIALIWWFAGHHTIDFIYFQF